MYKRYTFLENIGNNRIINVLTFDLIPTLKSFTLGEFLVVVLYFSMLIGYLIYSTYTFASAGRAYQFVVGHLSSIHLSLLALLPVARNSVLRIFFGISVERALKWHRMCARLMIFFYVFAWFIRIISISKVRRCYYPVNGLYCEIRLAFRHILYSDIFYFT